MPTRDVTDLQVCAAVHEFRAGGMTGPWPYEALAAETGEPEKVCFRAMERAENRGYLEAGVSTRTAWLTEKGEALLASTKVGLESAGRGEPGRAGSGATEVVFKRAQKGGNL